jgi:hypothetical protein
MGGGTRKRPAAKTATQKRRPCLQGKRPKRIALATVLQLLSHGVEKVTDFTPVRQIFDRKKGNSCFPAMGDAAMERNALPGGGQFFIIRSTIIG